MSMEHVGWGLALWIFLSALVMEVRRKRQNDIWEQQDEVYARNIRSVANAITSGVVAPETDDVELNNIAEYLDDRWRKVGNEDE